MIESYTVTLEWFEVTEAAIVGVMRNVASMKGEADSDGAPRHLWFANHIRGACAEMAFAKLTGMYWSHSVNKHSLPDVGEFEVRSTWLEDGSLRCYKKDSPGRKIVLAVGDPPTFTFVGWSTAEYIRERGTTNGYHWALDQDGLFPMEELFAQRGWAER